MKVMAQIAMVNNRDEVTLIRRRSNQEVTF